MESLQNYETSVVSIETLALDPENARVHPEENITAIMESLNRFGQVLPIIVHKGRSQIVGGNGTLTAMKRLGWNQCAVHYFDGAFEEAEALAIALNQTALLAKWDMKNLSKKFDMLVRTFGTDLKYTGFSDTAVQDMVNAFAMEGFKKLDPSQFLPQEQASAEQQVDGYVRNQVTSPTKDGCWFYVEFYGKEQLFLDLKQRLAKILSKTGHEISPEKFLEMVAAWEVVCSESTN